MEKEEIGEGKGKEVSAFFFVHEIQQQPPSSTHHQAGRSDLEGIAMSPDSLHPPRLLADRVEKLRGKLIRSFLLPLPALSPLSPSPGCSRCEANVTGKRGGKEREKEKERELRGEGKAHYTTNLFAGRKTAEDPDPVVSY